MINSVSDRIAARLPFFYGYVMIPVAMFVQIATSPGQTYAISAFTPSLRESLGMNDSLLSLAYMLGTVGAAFPLSFVGPLTDRYGLKGITLVAVGSAVLSVLLRIPGDGFFYVASGFLPAAISRPRITTIFAEWQCDRHVVSNTNGACLGVD